MEAHLSLQSAAHMFDSVVTFSHDLCPWGPMLLQQQQQQNERLQQQQQQIHVTDMFRATACFGQGRSTDDPNLSSSAPPGPFCHFCRQDGSNNSCCSSSSGHGGVDDDGAAGATTTTAKSSSAPIRHSTTTSCTIPVHHQHCHDEHLLLALRDTEGERRCVVVVVCVCLCAPREERNVRHHFEAHAKDNDNGNVPFWILAACTNRDDRSIDRRILHSYCTATTRE